MLRMLLLFPFFVTTLGLVLRPILVWNVSYSPLQLQLSANVVTLMHPALFEATEVISHSCDKPGGLTVHLELCEKKIRS